MAIVVTCAACGRVIRAPDTYAGKNIKCPQCAGPVMVQPAAPAQVWSQGSGEMPAAPLQPPGHTAQGFTPQGYIPPGQMSQGQPAPMMGAPAGPMPGYATGPVSPGYAPGYPPAGPTMTGYGPPPPGYPPGYPSPPVESEFAGVGQILEGEIQREMARQEADFSAALERQRKEKSWNDFVAPMFRAWAWRKKTLTQAFLAPRKMRSEIAFAHGFHVVKRYFPALLAGHLLVAFVGQIAMYCFLWFTVPALFLSFMPSEFWTIQTSSSLNVLRPSTEVVLALWILVEVVFHLGWLFWCWMHACRLRFILAALRGKRPKLVEFFRGGQFTLTFWSIVIDFSFRWQMCFLPLFVAGFINGLLRMLETPEAAFIGLLVGIVALIISGILCLLVLWRFFRAQYAFCIAVDKRRDAANAIEDSRTLIEGNYFQSAIVVFAGWLANWVLLIPLGDCILAAAYLDATGDMPRFDSQRPPEDLVEAESSAPGTPTAR